jgi:hypothetical protein
VKLLRTVPQLQSHKDNISADLCIHFVGGGLAGITAATSTYPLDLVRTRLAAQVRLKPLNIYFLDTSCASSYFEKTMSYFGFWNLLLDLDSDRNTVLF